MEKLEIKHLAPYLPYGLKVLIYNEDLVKILGVDFSTNLHVVLGKKENDIGRFHYSLTDIKPILRLFSDLTKKIEIESKNFVPIEILKKEYFVKEIDFFDVFNRNENEIGIYMKSIDYTIKPTPYLVYQKLFEWHFDVFGLIEKGLAVDINTI